MAEANPVQVEQPGENMQVENKLPPEGMAIEYQLACSTRSQFDSVPKTEIKNFHGIVSIQAPAYEQVNRSGIDCVCVLDVSGSMSGPKISLVRKSMRRLVRAMTAKDRVCFVTFDSNVSVLMEFTKMDNAGKESARKHIHALRHGSSTNLAGGLATGIEKMKELFLQGQANEVTSILLFTDGEANVGERTTEAILRRAVTATQCGNKLNVQKWSPEEVGQWLDSVRLPYKEQFLQNQVDGEMLLKDITTDLLKNVLGVTALHMGKFSREFAKLKELTSNQGEESPQFSVTINTFGFGASHNNQLLDKIAESFDGMYYYMENEEAIVSGFANCLGGMLSTVAQEITLTVKAANHVTGLKVHKSDHVTTNADGSIQAIVGDLQAEENQDVVISCDLPTVPEPIQGYVFFTCEVMYRNLVAENQGLEQLVGTVDRTDSAICGKVDMKVDIERNRIIGTDAIESAKACGDANKLAEGRAIVNAAMEKISKSASAKDQFVVSLLADLTECLDGLKDKIVYKSKGKGYMQQNVRCHRKKRAANFSSSKYRSQAMYQTSARDKRRADFTLKDDSDSDDEDEQTNVPRNRRRPAPRRQRPKKSKARSAPRRSVPNPSGGYPARLGDPPVPNLPANTFNLPPFPIQQQAPPIQQQAPPFPIQQQAPPFPIQQQAPPFPIQQQAPVQNLFQQMQPPVQQMQAAESIPAVVRVPPGGAPAPSNPPADPPASSESTQPNNNI